MLVPRPTGSRIARSVRVVREQVPAGSVLSRCRRRMRMSRCADFCAADVRRPFRDFRLFRGPERPANAGNIDVCGWLGG